MNKKTLGIILGITGNALILVGLSLVVLSFRNDSQQVYTEETNIKIEENYNKKSVACEQPLDNSAYDNKTTNIEVKKEVVTSNITNNKVNDSVKDTDTTNNDNTNASNNDNSNANNNEGDYEVEYKDWNYFCGLCGEYTGYGVGMCEECKTHQSNRGE